MRRVGRFGARELYAGVMHYPTGSDGHVPCTPTCGHVEARAEIVAGGIETRFLLAPGRALWGLCRAALYGRRDHGHGAHTVLFPPPDRVLETAFRKVPHHDVRLSPAECALRRLSVRGRQEPSTLAAAW